MKIKEMIQALQLQKKDSGKNQLMTVWGEHLNKDKVLEEYPRPQMVRNNYTILNGMWKYAFTLNSKMPEHYDGEILVPFSPEAYLSGVNRQLQPKEFLWYERMILLDEIPKENRLILHFGACDERCRVYVNGAQAGFHSGGYQAFSLDITPYIVTGENRLQVCVRDRSDTSYHGRGKQKLENGGMFYTAQSGIWQTVWYEWVPDIYVQKMHITPRYDESSVEIELFTNEKTQECQPCRIVIYENEVPVSEMTVSGVRKVTMPIPNMHSWSPIAPFLYQVIINYGEDQIAGYFGMRCFTVEKDVDNIPRLCLNHVPYFQNGILDQGYYPESLLTPVSDEAMIQDIMMAKKHGFNMIRKHCKIEPMRWYYHCDRLGMLVWQDMINGGEEYRLLYITYIPTVIKRLRKIKDNKYALLSRRNPKGRREWKKECLETIEQLYNCTCICTWVLFNEGWGQFDAAENTEMVRKVDNSRLIDAHSGWFDQNAGDLKSVHIYFFDLVTEQSRKPYSISEYGGLACGIEGHSYSDDVFGYGTYSVHDLKKEYKKMQRKIQDLYPEGLSAAVYTQLTDIEEEVNGLLTYDRKVSKLDMRL